MVGVHHWACQPRLIEQSLQDALSLDQRGAPQIETFEEEKIES